MGKTALVFPGQGSQYPEMLDYALGTCKEDSSDMLKTAEEILGYNPEKTCRNSKKLSQTQYAQPLVFLASALSWKKISEDVAPDYIAGHSLGEFSGLYASRSLSFEDALVLVKKRAELMQEASKGGSQGMWAVLGGERGDIESVIKGRKDLFVANYNCPGQVVISGLKGGFTEVEALLRKTSGVRKINPLAVSGAFHTPFMVEACSNFADELKECAPKFFQAVTAELVLWQNGVIVTRNREEIFSSMLTQMIRPVMFQDMVEYMIEQRIDTFIEAMPGKVLSGLIKRTAAAVGAEVKIFNRDNMSEIFI